MLELAKEKVAGQAVAGVTFEQRLLPFDPGSHQPADLVVCSSVIEYLDSVDDALKTFRTLLREGGTLIYSISNRDSLSRRLVRVVNAATGRPRYFRLLRHMLSEEEVVEVTTRAGFTVLEHAYFGAADVLNRLLGTILPARRASNMLIVAARRD
jgi:predicted TPR repeat methyltransferase